MGTKPVQTAKANWAVERNARARKGEEGLPEKWKLIIRALKRSLGKTGKAAGFENFGPLRPLGNDVFHCHLNTGKPRYVAVWKVDKQSRVITIIYIGTHANAPY